MIDLQSEQLVRLHDARKLTWLKGRDGGRLDIGTLRRWSGKGISPTRGAARVVLETVRIGTTAYTSVEAVLRFVDKLSVREEAATSPPRQMRRHEIARAEKRLDDAGIA